MADAAPLAKTTISPSDLTFGWSSCKRCLWLKYRHGISYSGPMPGLVMSLSRRQEKWYEDKSSHHFSTTLPTGTVHSTGLKVSSTPIVVDGEETPLSLSGKYDFLLEYDDGTWGIVDTKIVGKNGEAGSKAEFYWPQLAAYDYILAHPSSGEPRNVSTLGLVVWSVGDVEYDGSGEPRISFPLAYEPMDRQPQRFEKFIADVARTLLGPMPASGEKCGTCAFLGKAREALG